MDEETSRMRIQKTQVPRRPDNESRNTIISISKKLRRRTSEIPRVVFADEEHTSEVSLDRVSVKQSDLNDAGNIETVTTTKVEKELSIIDGRDALRDIEVRTKKHLGSQAEVVLLPTGSPKGDELGGETARESTRFSRVIPRPRSYRHDELESVLPTAIENSTISSARMQVSDNIDVKSMLIEVPLTDCLPHLEATAFAIVLQESLDHLGILEHVITAKVDERWDESYKTIDEKYGVEDEPKIMFREDMGLLPLIPTISEKIQRDRTYVYNILKCTARDIQCLRRYDHLETEVDDIVRILEGEHNLEINHETWMGQVKQLRELIESDRMKNEQEARNLLLLAQEMNAEVDNAILSNNSKLGYVRRWEEARLDQQKLLVDIEEQKLNDALESCATMEKADQIISGEVRTFLQANTKELEENIVAWESRYNKEIEHLQQKINETKEKIEFQKLDLQNLQDLRDERQIFLDKCYEERELLDREAEYWDAVNNAATIIQSLWRGYMVRHKLGRYKRIWESSKKKKSKKKTKAKGKKKS